mgnify:CR=1 FL=1
MSRFVELPREAMVNMLATSGFEELKDSSSGELVYIRKHHKNPNVQLKVYTSIAKGLSYARECGEDAIRVVVVYDNPNTGKNFGIYKATRTHRTGSVEKILHRTLTRMREAYGFANEWVKRRP